MKRCACCGATHTSDGWAELLLVGYLDDSDEPDGECLELRNCACGTTLAVEVDPTTTTQPPRQ